MSEVSTTDFERKSSLISNNPDDSQRCLALAICDIGQLLCDIRDELKKLNGERKSQIGTPEDFDKYTIDGELKS